MVDEIDQDAVSDSKSNARIDRANKRLKAAEEVIVRSEKELLNALIKSALDDNEEYLDLNSREKQLRSKLHFSRVRLTKWRRKLTRILQESFTVSEAMEAETALVSKAAQELEEVLMRKHELQILVNREIAVKARS